MRVPWPLAALLMLGCVRAPGATPPQAEAERPAGAEAKEAKEIPWHGLTTDGLAQVEALSGAGTVRLPVPPSHWGKLVAALGMAQRIDGRTLVGMRSPVLRFLRMDGTTLTLDLLGRDHWVFVEGKRQTTLSPCPALRQAAKVALRLACASGADHIAVARMRAAGGGPSQLEVVRTLKGSAVPGGMLRVEGRPLPSPGGPDALCLAFLRADGHGRGQPAFHRLLPVGTLWQHTDALEAKVRGSIALPATWGEAADGLRMGLRARSRAILLGEELRVEICIQNVGSRPVTLFQHRMNIYDYYPHTRFQVTLPDGSRLDVAKPEGLTRELDILLETTLQPGEVYIHTVRLGEWTAAPHTLLSGKGARRAFTHPGHYEIVCTYSVPRGGRQGVRAGTLTAAPLRLRVLTPPRTGKHTGGPV